MDALTRYHRMRGFNTLWVPGTDHAGIATQIVVERQLQDEGMSRHDIGRKNFVARVWDWKQDSGTTITGQMRRMGDTVDWTREYFTMDATPVGGRHRDLRAAVRGRPDLPRQAAGELGPGAAIGGVRPRGRERRGRRLPLAHPLPAWPTAPGSLVVATTRPETMLGDTAVMVHPDDERYTALIGKQVTLPLCDRTIPVIADAYVDREFGTGVVKVTPAHDANDYAVGQRHGLPMIGVLTLDAKINDNAPAAYRGLDRFVARKTVVADLEALGLLVETKKHKLTVPRCARTGQIVEPMLTDQWFVAMTKPGRRRRVASPAARSRAVEQRRRALRAGAVGQHLEPVDEEHPGLVHLAPALVGPPDPGLVRQRRRTVRRAQRRARRAPRPRPPATAAR